MLGWAGWDKEKSLGREENWVFFGLDFLHMLFSHFFGCMCQGGSDMRLGVGPLVIESECVEFCFEGVIEVSGGPRVLG